MRKLVMIICVAVLGSALSVAADWSLVWEENFSGDAIDTTVWKRIPRGKSDWNNYMSPADSLFAQRDGNLILRGVVNRTEKNDTAPYLTGGVWTYGGKMQFVPPFRVEVRARLHGAGGCWPAIWMLPADPGTYKYPTGGEIDIMERLNHDTIAYQTVHSYYTLNLKQPDNPPHGGTGAIRGDEEFNDYMVEVMPDSLSFFINGVKSLTYPRISTPLEGQYPFMIPMALLIDMQLGGSWVGPVNPAELPVEMEVDHVRYYRPSKE